MPSSSELAGGHIDRLNGRVGCSGAWVVHWLARLQCGWRGPRATAHGRSWEPKFTLRELQVVHEYVAGHQLRRAVFRRAMDSHIAGTGTVQENTETRGRPAEYYRRKP